MSAKFRGVRFESAKLMLEKEIPPDTTSGTVPIVVVFVSQVTAFWIDVTVSATSAGNVTAPTTKQAVARDDMAGAENC